MAMLAASGRCMVLAILALGQMLAGTPAEAGRFDFDQRRSEVHFVYTMGFATHRGRFTSVTGTLDYDAATPEKAKITASIAAASLTTGAGYIDDELKGRGFFSVATSPVIAFKSLAVHPRSRTEADVTGEITLRGITRPVTLKVRVTPHDSDPAMARGAGWHTLTAKTRIQRSAFEMTDWQLMVGDDVEIEISAIVRPRQ